MNRLPKCYRCHKQPCECRDGITLYHGDCTKILPLLDDAGIDLIFTDPPYGHKNNDGDMISKWETVLGKRRNRGKLDNRPIDNDGKEADDLVRWFFKESSRLLKPGANLCCCCGGGGPDPQAAKWMLWLNREIPFKQMVIWDKGPMGLGWHYRRSYEVVLVATQPGAKCAWFGGTRVENIIRPGDYGIKKIIPSMQQHPTEKPKELAGLFINIHSEPGWLVLDPFAGVGTTLQAAKDLGRRAIGIELDLGFCKAIADRLKQPALLDMSTMGRDGRKDQLGGFGIPKEQVSLPARKRWSS